MSADAATGVAVGAHLVGGVKAASAEEAMRTVAGTLGAHLYALTDGETGPRSKWVVWQFGVLQTIDGIALGGIERVYADSAEDAAQIPKLTVAPSVRELPARSLGYATEALSSFEIFKRLRAEGVIPGGVKFQVSVPTPLAPIVGFVADADQASFYPIYTEALAAEVTDIIMSIPAEDLMLQFDVALEIGILCGAVPASGMFTDKAFMIEQIGNMLSMVPADVEHGVHLCYGDFQHAHFAVPQDLSLCVEFANALADKLDFVHMPVDRETGLKPAYHEPLRELEVAGRLALGVVDFHGDERRSRELAAVAAGVCGREFAVATECGMARIDDGAKPGPPLQRLLDLHTMLAQPIR